MYNHIWCICINYRTSIHCNFQAIVKQFAKLLDFVLKFDESKMMNPALQVSWWRNNMHYWRAYYLEQHFMQHQIAVKESWSDELLTTILCLHNPPTLTEQCKNTIWLLCKVKSVVVDIFLGWWPPSNGHWIGSYRQQWKRRGNCISFDRNNRIWSSALDWILVILSNNTKL